MPWEGWARKVGSGLAKEQNCNAAAFSAGSFVFPALPLRTCSSASPNSSRIWEVRVHPNGTSVGSPYAAVLFKAGISARTDQPTQASFGLSKSRGQKGALGHQKNPHTPSGPQLPPRPPSADGARLQQLTLPASAEPCHRLSPVFPRWGGNGGG